ncbi:DUF927 domain-containing protein [Falsiroseomonas tokyonensis]|uniref:DUF927 domain-containing protein n=1 Tax=Falsiroseomonas tokyonensis TaxID=430521 RepID=A0ABV7BVT0_9PROT|nr:DUF927 domain-containing protein [Falsiroseomonas tokyonensis]
MPDRTDGRFDMNPVRGLFCKREEKTPLWLSAPFRVLAETRDPESRAWGLLLHFRNRDGVVHELAIPKRLIAGEGGEVRQILADCGLDLASSQAARQAFMDYLCSIQTPERAVSVPRIGWHRVGDRLVFVLPDGVIGEARERVILQSAEPQSHDFRKAGSLEDWKAKVGALCIGNSRLMLAASTALAGPLLELLGEEGGGVHYVGNSSVGKSAAGRVAASVWGGGPREGAKDFWRSWNGTANGQEGAASLHNDALMILDEMNQARAQEVGDVVFMIANGAGKLRAQRSGFMRQQARFRLLVFSTGEGTLEAKMAEAGQRVMAGQEVRLVHVPADAGAGHGLFEDLHGCADGGALAKRIEAVTRHHYGVAARAFIVWLTSQMAVDEAAFRRRLAELVDAVFKRLAPAGADGQVQRMTRRFALIAAAGELAAEAGIVPWPPTDAECAARLCLEAALSERGTVGAREDAAAMRKLRDFLLSHGPSRFEVWADRNSRRQDAEDRGGDGQEDHAGTPPPERFRAIKRAGWRRWQVNPADAQDWRWVYYVTSEGMAEALAGLNPRAAMRVLVERGHVIPGADGKSSKALSVAGVGKTRLYEIAPALLATGDAGEAP